MNIDSRNVEDCHWIKIQGPKKVIIKFSRRKDGINKPIYINDSLCTYYKKPWAKCKKLRDNQVIHAFWISNGSINLKVSETGDLLTVTHDVGLEALFPGNSLIEDVRRI